MRLADESEEMERVEDLFARYQVPFDPQVLAVHRVRILKRFGQWAAALDGMPDPAEKARRLAQVLSEVYDTVARGEGLTRPEPAPVLVQIRRPAAAGRR
ncbi:MAG TPA: nitrogenase-stabilizing/protective protein NifW [Polyangia bacterium]